MHFLQYDIQIQEMYFFWYKFNIIIFQIGAVTVTSNGAIWDEFSEQHKPKHSLYLMYNMHCLSAYKVQI